MHPRPDVVILDTDAFSFLVARRPQAASYPSVLRGKVPALAFVSVAELHFGAMYARWGEKRTAELTGRIRQMLVLPYDEQLALLWARLKVDACRQGHPLGQRDHANDLWIAASALYHQAPLLTGNMRHFDGLPGLSLIDGSGR
jgi:predicted nucleic acid-binding protein